MSVQDDTIGIHRHSAMMMALPLAGAFGADDVFAVKTLTHGDAGFAGDTTIAADSLQALTLLRGVEDEAAFTPRWGQFCFFSK